MKINEPTHLICAECGTLNTMSKINETEDKIPLSIIDCNTLMFTCRNCKISYELPINKQTIDNDAPRIIEVHKVEK